MKISVLAGTLASPNKIKNGPLVPEFSYDKMRILYVALRRTILIPEFS